jgi:CBS domain-containing protein
VDGTGRVVGVVSETDLMPDGAAPRGGEPEAAAIMRAPAITVDRQDTLAEAARRMRQARVHHLPVVDVEGRAVGMLSRGDLLKVFTRGDDSIRQAIVDGLLVGHLWADPSDVQVTVRNGVVSLGGRLHRRSDALRFQRLLPSVDGVVGVEGEVGYRFDDVDGE